MFHVAAIFWREFAAYFGQPLAYVVLAVFTALLAVPTLVMWDIIDAGQADMQSTFFWTGTAFVFLVPALTMRLIAEERRTGSLELLSTLPITPAQLVLGKWLAAVAMVAMALVLTLSWPIALGSLGSLDPFTVITGYIGMLLMGAAFAAVGLAASAVTKHQVLAFLLAFVIIAVPYLLGYALESMPPEILGYVQYLTFRYHFANLARGVIDTRSLIFFGGLIAVGLRGAVLTLQWRRLT